MEDNLCESNQASQFPELPFEHPRTGAVVTPVPGLLQEEGTPLPQAAVRYLDGSTRSWWERVQDLWFAPKRFERPALYERLGVRLIKRYVPTGGDVVIRRYGIRIVYIRSSLDSLIAFERFTRRLEAIHELVFLAFLGFSLWRALTRQTTLLNLGFAIVVYFTLILSPALLQRYNRLRIYPIIRRLVASQARFKQEKAGEPSAARSPGARG